MEAKVWESGKSSGKFGEPSLLKGDEKELAYRGWASP
jgi:hypothetical protein